jgi:hypothetical protein
LNVSPNAGVKPSSSTSDSVPPRVALPSIGSWSNPVPGVVPAMPIASVPPASWV